MTEPRCELCDAGIEVIDGWHYTRVGGMVFPTNRRCAKVHPPKPRPEKLGVFLVPSMQCATCGGVIDWCQGPRLSEDVTHYEARCKGCEVTVRVPLTLRWCEVVV